MECDPGKEEGKIGKRNEGEKGPFWAISVIFLDKSFLKKVSGHLAYEETTNMLNLSS